MNARSPGSLEAALGNTALWTSARFERFSLAAPPCPCLTLAVVPFDEHCTLNLCLVPGGTGWTFVGELRRPGDRSCRNREGGENGGSPTPSDSTEPARPRGDGEPAATTDDRS